MNIEYVEVKKTIEIESARLHLSQNKPFAQAKAELLAKFPTLHIVDENEAEGWIELIE